MSNASTKFEPLHLRVGEIAEVRSEQEILATLDEQGGIDGMPFMPEMLEFCGKRYSVYRRADKTCDTITVTGSRRIYDAVHLDDLRCSGAGHDGCQALCLLYWKEAWLKRVNGAAVAATAESRATAAESAPHSHPAPAALRCNPERLVQLTRSPDPANANEVLYHCQATDLLKASEPLPWWDVRQYWRDMASGNVGLFTVMKSILFRAFYKSSHFTAFRIQVWLFNQIQRLRGSNPYPYLAGKLDKTPRETLDLQPGELVQVKSYGEVLETLNKRNRNQGLYFDAEMVPYCGTQRRVLARVDRIVDERSGRMVTFTKDCLILAGAICKAKFSDRRLFCPRSIYPYWREIWLKRVDEKAGVAGGSESD